MKTTKTLAVIWCALSIGWVSIAAAGNGDIYGSGSNFSSVKSTKAKTSSALRAQISIPPEIAQGDEFQLICVVETLKNHEGRPQSGVKGSLALFAISLDVSSRTWDFFGLRDSGISFKTKKNGTAEIKSGVLTAGPWANNPSDNDIITATAQFTNAKKISETSLYCEIIVGE